MRQQMNYFNQVYKYSATNGNTRITEKTTNKCVSSQENVKTLDNKEN